MPVEETTSKLFQVSIPWWVHTVSIPSSGFLRHINLLEWLSACKPNRFFSCGAGAKNWAISTTKLEARPALNHSTSLPQTCTRVAFCFEWLLREVCIGRFFSLAVGFSLCIYDSESIATEGKLFPKHLVYFLRKKHSIFLYNFFPPRGWSHAKLATQNIKYFAVKTPS